MDWSKSKNIMIIALLFTNVFLLFMYITKNDILNSGEENEIYIKALKNKNVEIDCPVKMKLEKMHTLKITYDKETLDKKNNFFSNENNSVLKEILQGKELTEKEVKKCIETIFEKSKLPNKYLVFKEIVKDENPHSLGNIRVTYQNYYKNKGIGGSFVDFYFQDEKLVNIQGKFIQDIAESENQIQISNPYIAMLDFVSQKEKNQKDEIPQKTVIKGIEEAFVINGKLFQGEDVLSDTAFPAWEILFDEDGVVYIESYIE